MRTLSGALALFALTGCISIFIKDRPVPPDQELIARVDLDANDRTKATGFVFLGDTGTGEEAQYQVAKGMQTFCKVELCQFAALLGDNIYEGGVGSVDDSQWESKFEEPYRNLPLRFYAVLGNHDYRGNIWAEIDYTQQSKKWVMPARYYRFSVRDVDLFAIDSERFDPAQVKWLDRQLQASTARWKVVYGHHPLRSYGHHGDSAWLVERLLPLLARHKVDFYLAGHEHEKQVLAAEGLIMVISGGGGRELRAVGKGPRTQFAISSHGFAHLLLDGEKARLRVLDHSGSAEYEKIYTKK